jgi:hypothetical protein
MAGMNSNAGDNLDKTETVNLGQSPDTPTASELSNDDALPDKIAVKIINQRSADWTVYHYAWDLMNMLYVGGCEIEAVAEQFLLKRSKELSDVYQSRVERFYYEDHIGAAVDWYLAALLEIPPRVETALKGDQAPKITFTSQSEKVDPTKGFVPQPPPAVHPTTSEDPNRSKTPAEVDDFYDEFEQNCDRAGTPVLETIRAFFRNLLIFGRAVILIDLPPKGDYKNLQEEKEAGQYNPFLVNWDPRQMINYSADSHGQLNWVVFENRETVQATAFSQPTVSDNWYYYDRTRYAKYSRVIPKNENEPPKDSMAELVVQGEHSQAKLNRVPVLYEEVPKGLWLVNRAFSVAKEHLNTACTLSWALYMACLAMPVIKMDGEYTPTLSEAGFIKLPKEADYGWSEPEGKSFMHLMSRLETLKEELFRAFYLISQSRSSSATAAAASGVSKQQDMAPSKKVLNLYGDIIRSLIQAVYNYVSVAHEDSITWDVRGLSFPEGPPDEELDTIAGAMAIDIPSLTFEKEMYKKAAMSVLPDMNPKIKEKIFREIDVAPSAADRAMDQQNAKGSMIAQRAATIQAADIFPKGSM